MERNACSTRETRQSSKRETRNSSYSRLELDTKNKTKRRKSQVSSDCNEVLNMAFIEEELNNAPLSPLLDNKAKRKRRLSGWYRKNLSTGLIQEITHDEDTEYDQENTENNILEAIDSEETHEDEDADNIMHQNEEDFINTKTHIEKEALTEIFTPVKYKLRKKSKSEWTQEQIIEYYTNKNIKKKRSNLETLYENSNKRGNMGKRKYKRFINFAERYSEAQTKKRRARALKYNILENFTEIDMDYFLLKLESIENEL